MQEYTPEDLYLVDSYGSRDFVRYLGCIGYPTEENRVARWQFSLGDDQSRAVLSYDLDRGLEVVVVDLGDLLSPKVIDGTSEVCDVLTGLLPPDQYFFVTEWQERFNATARAEFVGDAEPCPTP